jgi:hypothetical protein
MTTVPTETVDIFSRNLGRGKACEPCRRRKLRCDGNQPVCGRCNDARMRRINRMRQKGVTQEHISQISFPPCFSEDSQIDTSYNNTTTTFDDIASPAKQRRLNGKERESGSDNDLYFAEILSSHLPLNVGSLSRSAEESPPTPFSPANLFDHSPSSSSRHPTTLQGAASFGLPPAAQIEKLTKVFLEAYRMYGFFQPQRLLDRLAKGPEHEDYPHDAAIHIILALAYAERPDLDESLTEGPADARKGAHYRHSLAAQYAIFEAMHLHNSRGRFFDIARALILLCFKQYAFGDLWESYMSNASAMRGCIALNLNKEAPNEALLSRQLLDQTMLPRITDGSFMQMKPRDAIEVEEVRRTMMMAFACDRSCCATTLWPASLADEDYTTSMPRTTLEEFIKGTFTEEIMNRHPRYLNNQDFYTSQAIDADQLVFKGSVILGKCAELISRLPRDATKDYISSLPNFQKLENYITTLQLNNSSFAASLVGMPTSQNSMAAFSLWLTMDRDASPHFYNSLLITSTCMPYACTLTLHEPFANLSEESEAACRGASRSIINIIRVSLFLAILRAFANIISPLLIAMSS